MAMKTLCVVAHPDDCIIFAWPFIETFYYFDWTILYLTYNEQDERAQEVKNFWKRRNVNTYFLGNIDTYLDMENNQISFDTVKATEKIIEFTKDYDIILTHDSAGDYGHIHHKFVHSCVDLTKKAKIFFAKQEESNFECNRKEVLNLEEIPLHSEVVSGFKDSQIGRYNMSTEAKRLINQYYTCLFSII